MDLVCDGAWLKYTIVRRPRHCTVYTVYKKTTWTSWPIDNETCHGGALNVFWHVHICLMQRALAIRLQGTLSRTFSDFFTCFFLSYTLNFEYTRYSGITKMLLHNAPPPRMQMSCTVSLIGFVQWRSYINSGPSARTAFKATHPDLSRGLGGRSELLHWFRACASEHPV